MNAFEFRHDGRTNPASLELEMVERKGLGHPDTLADAVPEQATAPTRRKRQHKVEATDLDLSQPIELVVLPIKERTARCRLPETDRVISLRASRLWDIVPGEIAMVTPRNQWNYAGHPYLSGEIESARFDVGRPSRRAVTSESH